MRSNASLKISRQSAPAMDAARLLSSAALGGARRPSDMPPPDVTLKKKFLGLENGIAIYAGIAIAAAILLPLASVGLKKQIRLVLSHFDKPTPAPPAKAAPRATP